MQLAQPWHRSILRLARPGAAAALLLGACHLGVPPQVGATAVHLEVVDVAAVEPALADALRVGLTDAFAARGLAGGSTPLALRVLEASTAAAAATDILRIHRARLAVEVQLLGPAPRTVVLRGERAYPVDPMDGLAAAAARAAAFQALAGQLSEDAALWLAYDPGAASSPGSPPPPGPRP